jgi:hypothetical protein
VLLPAFHPPPPECRKPKIIFQMPTFSDIGRSLTNEGQIQKATTLTAVTASLSLVLFYAAKKLYKHRRRSGETKTPVVPARLQALAEDPMLTLGCATLGAIPTNWIGTSLVAAMPPPLKILVPLSLFGSSLLYMFKDVSKNDGEKGEHLYRLDGATAGTVISCK